MFLPRKHSVSGPKFNLLGLKPNEDFQPYKAGFFQPHGLGKTKNDLESRIIMIRKKYQSYSILVEDETVWKKSLRDLAMSIGFITQHEIDRIEKPPTLSNFYGPPSTTGSLRTSVPSTGAGPTPRFNETLPPSSRGERMMAKGYAKPLWYYRVDDHEREAWVR